MKRTDLNLWGIGDPTVEKAIIAEAMKRSLKRTFWLVVLIAAGIAALLGLSIVAVTRLFSLPRHLLGWPVGVISGVCSSTLIILWQRKQLFRHLPEVLREQNRCLQCGYQLTPETRNRCPECGSEGE